jgi:hypothetical protein
MMSHKNGSNGKRRRRAVAIVYVVLSLVALLGFCSLAVDLGRVQVAKTELRRAADAAARAAAAQLSTGNDAAVIAAAVYMAGQNNVDGTPVVLNPATDVVFINWISHGNFTVVATAAQANAVKVYCRRTAATNNPIPLMFASILGARTCDVNASATAALNASATNQFVTANSNPWLAGEPDGTLASKPDAGYYTPGPGLNPLHKWQNDVAGPNGTTLASGEKAGSPTQISMQVTPGSTVTISNVSGLAINYLNATPSYDATGSYNGGQYVYNDEASGGSSEHGLSDTWAPLNSMLGVFLTDAVPDNNSPPAVLDFSTQAARDYSSLSPLTQQVFYVGDGQTSSGTQQTIVVPQGATRLFLGTMDGHEWSNNLGGFNATITQTNISIVE